jgi:prolyl oligopeptidase
MRDRTRLAGTAATPRRVIQAADVIESAAIAGDRIVVHYLVDVRAACGTISGEAAGKARCRESGVGWALNGRPSRPELFYSFVSFLTPTSIYRYDLRRKRVLPSAAGVPFDGAHTRRDRYSTSPAMARACRCS